MAAEPALGARTLSEASPVLQGFLEKKGFRHKNWRKRWCVFDPRTRTLRYFTDESCDVLKGALTVGSVVDVPNRPRKRSHRFNLGVFSDPGASAVGLGPADAPGAHAATSSRACVVATASSRGNFGPAPGGGRVGGRESWRGTELALAAPTVEVKQRWLAVVADATDERKRERERKAQVDDLLRSQLEAQSAKHAKELARQKRDAETAHAEQRRRDNEASLEKAITLEKRHATALAQERARHKAAEEHAKQDLEVAERKAREAHTARAKADQDRERSARAGAAAVAASKADREKLSDAEQQVAALSDELRRLQTQVEEADKRAEMFEADLSAERKRGQEEGRRERETELKAEFKKIILAVRDEERVKVSAAEQRVQAAEAQLAERDKELERLRLELQQLMEDALARGEDCATERELDGESAAAVVSS